MGDPFSVAGSAVGVVSLGLQVCQGLASYIDKYKSADKEVKNCKCKVEGLNLILQELYDLLKGADGTDPPLSGKFKVALRMITDCESGIEDVKITLSKIQTDSSEPSQGVFPKIKTASKRALYPFRRDALVGLLTVLEGLQENLDTALALLQIVLSLDSKTRIVSLQQSTINIDANTSRTLALTQGFEQRHEDMGQILSRLDQRMEQMQSTITHYSIRNLPEPATLRSICDAQQEVDRDFDDFVTSLQSTKHRQMRGCFCSTPNGFTSAITHRRGCPRFVPSQRVKVLQSQYKFCGRFLSYAVDVSLSITTGAGGFAISPNLAFRAIVRDSPTFELMTDAIESFRYMGGGLELLKDLRVKLFRLFQEGKASPTDTDVYGDTIFHLLMDLIASTLFSTNAACLPAAHQLLIELSSSSSLPTNVDCYGRTVADKLLYELSMDTLIQGRVTNEIQISGYLIEIFFSIMEGGVSQTHGILRGEHYINYANGCIGDAFRFNLTQKMIESTNNWNFHVPELFEPLMIHDKKLLHSLLTSPSFLKCSEIPYSYNYWPEGLHLLLQSGKLPSREALLHACYVNLPGSVGLLLSARWFYIESRHMGAASRGQSIETMSLIVDAFVEERRELQSLAKHHLTSEEVASLHLKSHSLLDFQAHRAYELLQASGLTLPDWGNENQGYLAYVSIRDNCAMADFLWHGGYRDVDEMDSEGCTSLMFSQTLGFTDWLVSHGADIHRRVCGIPALHLMADNVHLNIWPVSSSDKGILPTFQLLLQDKAQDHCDCPCSSAGCLAITRFLHNALTRAYQTGPRDIFDMIHLLSELISLLEEDPALHAAFEIIRFFTFEALQIPHTCRHPVQCLSTEDGDCDYSPHLEPCYHWEPKDWEEIDEMQDEWRELISVHGDLVARFQIMYETSDLLLCEFLDTFWREELLKRSENDDPLSQEEISRVRELGVILHEGDDDLSGDGLGEEELKSDAQSS